MKEILRSGDTMTELLAYDVLCQIGLISNGLKRLLDADFYDLFVHPIGELLLSDHHEEGSIESIHECGRLEMLSRVIRNHVCAQPALRVLVNKGFTAIYIDASIRYIRSKSRNWSCIKGDVVPARRKLVNANVNTEELKNDLIQKVSEPSAVLIEYLN